MQAMFLATSRLIAYAVLLIMGVGELASTAQMGGRLAAAEAEAARQSAVAQATRAQLEAWWSDLASADEGRALRAVLALVAKPETVAFLKERLQPVIVDPKVMARRIADLDDDKFEKRQQATVDLENCGASALPYLQQVLDGQPSLEMRRRAEQLVERIQKEVKPSDWPRTSRALAVLEFHAAAEARALLQALATGSNKALLTWEAKAALERQDRRWAPAPAERFNHLGIDDDGHAARAVLALSKSPKDTLALFKEKLVQQPPVPVPDDPRRIAQLIADLDGNNQKVRELAAKALDQLGKAAVPALRTARTDGNLKEETRTLIDLILIFGEVEAQQAEMRGKKQRMEKDLVDNLLPGDPRPNPKLQAKRAMILLEYFDTPAANELLEAIRRSTESAPDSTR
jgi:hypothetical protein